MKTNAVPAIIMLTAGLIDCILSFYEHVSLFLFTKRLLIVLVVFYILGCIVKIILDCNFKEPEETGETEPEDALEEADTTDDANGPEVSEVEEADDMEAEDTDTE